MIEKLKNRIGKIVAQVEQQTTKPSVETKQNLEAPEVERKLLHMFEESADLREWLRFLLYRSGLKDVIPHLEHISPAALREQLASNAELRQNVMDAIADANEWCASGYEEWIRSGYSDSSLPWWKRESKQEKRYEA